MWRDGVLRLDVAAGFYTTNGGLEADSPGAIEAKGEDVRTEDASDGIESTFEEIERFVWARVAFRGRHFDEDAGYRVVRDYVVEHDTEYLEGSTRYYVDDELVRECANWWPIDPATGAVGRHRTPIETFCRDHHRREREGDIELLRDRFDAAHNPTEPDRNESGRRA